MAKWWWRQSHSPPAPVAARGPLCWRKVAQLTWYTSPSQSSVVNHRAAQGCFRAPEQVALVLLLAQPLSVVHPPPVRQTPQHGQDRRRRGVPGAAACSRPLPGGVFTLTTASANTQGFDFPNHSSGRVGTEGLLGTEDDRESDWALQTLVLLRCLQKPHSGCFRNQPVLGPPRPHPTRHTLPFPRMRETGPRTPLQKGCQSLSPRRQVGLGCCVSSNR